MRSLEAVLARLPDARKVGLGYSARCPAHEDRNPSLSIKEGEDGRVLLKCFAGCEVESVCAALEVRVADLFERRHVHEASRRNSLRRGVEEKLSVTEARETWRKARARALDDERVHEDRDVYEFLASRGLSEAWEASRIGILSEGMQLPDRISWWPRSGYRLVLPLHDEVGRVSSYQGRSVRAGVKRKTRFPKGSATAGLLFANGPARDALARGLGHTGLVVYAEGLTDFLAISCVLGDVPVFSSPGTSHARAGVGAWARGARVVLAFDNDPAGQKATGEVAEKLYQRGAGAVARIVWPRGAGDACDVIGQIGPDRFGEFIDQEVRGAGS